MIGSGLIMIIRDEAKKGKSPYRIAKEQGISKNTVKKYLKAKEVPAKSHKRGSMLDPFKSQIDQMIGDGIYNCVVILESLRAQGYMGGKTIIKDYVHAFRPPKTVPAVPRYETLPGRQAQMDWGICSYFDENGEIHKAQAFVMILGYSRAKYVEFTKRCDLKSLERSILNAFEYSGGVPDVVLTDNMKTVVLRHEGGKTIFLPAFESFCADLGFNPSTCKARRPRTKGKVERLVRYLKENFLPGRRFSSLYDLNAQVQQWCKHVDSKKHGTTGRIPLQMLSEEKLQALPPMEIRDRYRWEARKVTKDGFVSFDGHLYGVDWRYSGMEAQVRLYRNHVQIYVDQNAVADIPLADVREYYVPQGKQYAGLAAQDGIAWNRSIAIRTKDDVTERPLKIYDRLMEEMANA
jgi:transposase